jgi:hypothetical protein
MRDFARIRFPKINRRKGNGLNRRLKQASKVEAYGCKGTRNQSGSTHNEKRYLFDTNIPEIVVLLQALITFSQQATQETQDAPSTLQTEEMYPQTCF